MNKKQLIVAGMIIALLIVIICQLGFICNRVDYIDWGIRNILGKMK